MSLQIGELTAMLIGERVTRGLAATEMDVAMQTNGVGLSKDYLRLSDERGIRMGGQH